MSSVESEVGGVKPGTSLPEGLRTVPKDKKGRRRKKRGLVGNVALAGATLILGTGTAIVADKVTGDQGVEIPGLHRTLGETKDTVIKLILEKGPAAREAIEQFLGRSPEIPRSFKSDPEYGIAKGGWNTVSVPEERFSSLLRNAVKPSPDGSINFSLLYPAKLGTDERGIFHIGSGGYENSGGGMTLTLPKKGTEIVLPVAEAEVFQAPLWYVEGVPYFNGFFVRFNAPDGTPFEMTIYPLRDARGLVPADLVKDAPIIEERSVRLGENRSTIERIFPSSGGIKVRGGTVIGFSGLEYAEITFRLGSSGPRKPLHFRFITEEVDGNLKIVTPK